MDIKAFSFNSQAKYRTGGHFKEKTILSLANQEIMVDSHENHFKAMFPIIFADYQNPPLTGDVAMANKAWQIWQSSPLSLTSPSGAPLPVVGFHLRTTSKQISPFLPACTASTSTKRPGARLKSCVSPSHGINLIHGTRMHMTPEPISGFALSSVCHQTLTGGRRWITDVKVSDLGAPSRLHLGHIDMRMRRKAHSSTRRMPCAIR